MDEAVELLAVDEMKSSESAESDWVELEISEDAEDWGELLSWSASLDDLSDSVSEIISEAALLLVPFFMLDFLVLVCLRFPEWEQCGGG